MNIQHRLKVRLGMTALMLAIAGDAWATAPRISAQMFGEETHADIVAYQSAGGEAKTKGDEVVALELVKEAFAAVGKSPVVDVLPSAQLARYAMTNHDAAAMIGGEGDIPAKESSQNPAQNAAVVFYLKGDAPIALIFARDDARAEPLRNAFNQGLQKIFKNGKYLDILEKHLGKGHVPMDFEKRLKRFNPNLK